ncbi:hypothetical protein CBS101457_002472 [Exobasidium rhododendri]|nr:hypothetical protein CBS101457_002472 [Exobasidium rhododendri]
MTWPNPPIARSIFGWDPLDEFATIIGDWMLEVSQGSEHLEIEGKVGRIVDKHNGDRINIPVRTETVVEMQSNWKFESTMSESQHRKINGVLNTIVQDQSQGMRYERQQEIDCFHRTPEGSVRVTRDAKTMIVKEKGIMRKRRLADINIFSPNRALDYRISVNVEVPESEVPSGEPDYTREKNRLHYTHQNVCIDLTQVHAADSQNIPSNELEVEFRDARKLMAEAAASTPAAARQEWTPYYDEVLVFVNNLRMLIRNAGV